MALYRTESHQSNISQLSIASGLRDDYYVGNADEEVLSSSSLQSDDESVIIQKSLSFFSKYGGESEEERFDLDADDISDDRIARMQTHIIDCVVTLMRVQSIQSEERVEASQPSHKLFSSVVMKLLCHNSANAIKEFGALDGLKTLDRRPMITPAAATAGSGVKPRLDSSVTSSAGIGYLLQAFPDEQKSRDSRYWLKLHWLAALGCESLTARDAHAIISSDPLAIVRGLSLSSGTTPAHIAAAAGSTSILKLLVDYSSARVAAEASLENDLPLHLACTHSGSVETVSLLLDLHPLALSHRGYGGMTPLLSTVVSKNTHDITRCLLTRDGGTEACLIPDDRLNTPLHIAAITADSDTDLSTFMLLWRASPRALGLANAESLTPLHCLARNSNFGDHDRPLLCERAACVVSELLQTTPVSATAITSSGRLPLHFAAECSNLLVVDALVRAYPPAVSAATEDGETPLLRAICGNNEETFEYLRAKNPALIARADRNNMLPLHHAALRASPLLCSRLLELLPSSAAHPSMFQRLPIHGLVEEVAEGLVPCSDDDSILRLLLRYYPEGVVARDSSGNTPYSMCPKGSIYLRRVLLRAWPAASYKEFRELNCCEERSMALLLAYRARYMNPQRKGIFMRLARVDVELLKRCMSFL